MVVLVGGDTYEYTPDDNKTVYVILHKASYNRKSFMAIYSTRELAEKYKDTAEQFILPYDEIEIVEYTVKDKFPDV